VGWTFFSFLTEFSKVNENFVFFCEEQNFLWEKILEEKFATGVAHGQVEQSKLMSITLSAEMSKINFQMV
jgi:hypothetical protein